MKDFNEKKLQSVASSAHVKRKQTFFFFIYLFFYDRYGEEGGRRWLQLWTLSPDERRWMPLCRRREAEIKQASRQSGTDW